MSSPYVTLGNRPLEQWKVTELKEELKKRKLTTKGLKEDLLKRLDEAVRTEQANASAMEDDEESESPTDQVETKPVASGKDKDPLDASAGIGEKLEAKSEQNVPSDVDVGAKADLVKETKAVSETEMKPVKTIDSTGETVEPVTELSESNLPSDGKSKHEDSPAMLSGAGLQLQDNAKVEPPTKPDVEGSETQNEGMDSTIQMESDDSKSHQPDSDVQPLKFQVSEVNPDLGSQVASDSVSTESVPLIEKNELKIDVITDNVKLELDVKPEVGQTSVGTAASDDGKLEPAGDEAPLSKDDTDDSLDKKDVEQPLDKVESMEATDAENIDNLRGIDSVDLGPPEKLSLDRSSGDDSMEEDVMDSKQMEYKSDSNKAHDIMETSEKPVTDEDDHVDVVGHDKPAEMKPADAEKETASAQGLSKRKFYDKEAAGQNDPAKKARRWNTEGSKGSEQQSNTVAASITPKGLPEPTFKRAGPDPVVNEESPKERIVPPTSKPPTNSLRIDRFLRPFTLKAVQELLGKTGTVTSFWMDHIKTHCYVSYSSVEEAVETRNAVYNLQWPPNGGRTLVAEFVEPQEVKARLEAPPVTPTTPSTSAAAIFSASKTQPSMPPQPSPRQQQPQHLPPPPLPPPQMSNPPFAKERLHPSREPLPMEQQPLPLRDRVNLPPPPPLPDKADPPIVTLDDLFRKTKAMPRIYYLPLSDEQVAAKVKSQGKNVNQSAGVPCRMMMMMVMMFFFRCGWCCFLGGFMFLRWVVEAEFIKIIFVIIIMYDQCMLLLHPPSRPAFQLRHCCSRLVGVARFSRPQTLTFLLVENICDKVFHFCILGLCLF
ncbi:uncharacterized protein LOC127240231 [Andrographis paniculata]|uniref:uncharacterized protein LOC127240231 n=1 Tax=Andrographis paniculata TaxID=175694 RepID=UPI0021E929BE|nr:uncharacterized protein LOC127240231 [Andrographis paniculata]